MLTESVPQTPDDAQVKAVLDKMAAAASLGQLLWQTCESLSLLTRSSRETPEHVFHIDDRQIPGPAGMSQSRIYTLNQREACHPGFLHGGGFVAGNLDTHIILCVQ